jgi:membrane protein implicated in regulation of membrane protease activity
VDPGTLYRPPAALALNPPSSNKSDDSLANRSIVVSHRNENGEGRVRVS